MEFYGRTSTSSSDPEPQKYKHTVENPNYKNHDGTIHPGGDPRGDTYIYGPSKGPTQEWLDWDARRRGVVPTAGDAHFAPEDPGVDVNLDMSKYGFGPTSMHRKGLLGPGEAEAYDRTEGRVKDAWNQYYADPEWNDAAQKAQAALQVGDKQGYAQYGLIMQKRMRELNDSRNSILTGGNGTVAPRGSQAWPTPKSPLGIYSHDGKGDVGGGSSSGGGRSAAGVGIAPGSGGRTAPNGSTLIGDRGSSGGSGPLDRVESALGGGAASGGGAGKFSPAQFLQLMQGLGGGAPQGGRVAPTLQGGDGGDNGVSWADMATGRGGGGFMGDIPASPAVMPANIGDAPAPIVTPTQGPGNMVNALNSALKGSISKQPLPAWAQNVPAEIGSQVFKAAPAGQAAPMSDPRAAMMAKINANRIAAGMDPL